MKEDWEKFKMSEKNWEELEGEIDWKQLEIDFEEFKFLDSDLERWGGGRNDL